MWVEIDPEYADAVGRPTRASWMEDHVDDAEEDLPIEWTDSDSANVPRSLGEALVDRHDVVRRKDADGTAAGTNPEDTTTEE